MCAYVYACVRVFCVCEEWVARDNRQRRRRRRSVGISLFRSGETPLPATTRGRRFLRKRGEERRHLRKESRCRKKPRDLSCSQWLPELPLLFLFFFLSLFFSSPDTRPVEIPTLDRVLRASEFDPRPNSASLPVCSFAYRISTCLKTRRWVLTLLNTRSTEHIHTHGHYWPFLFFKLILKLVSFIFFSFFISFCFVFCSLLSPCCRMFVQ